MSEVQSGLQLLFDLQPEDEPKVRLGWCVPEDILKSILKKGEYTPDEISVCVVVIDAKGRERRYVHPFKDGRAWLYFYSPGNHEIHAGLILGNQKVVKQKFLKLDYFDSTSFSLTSIWNGTQTANGWRGCVPPEASEERDSYQRQIKSYKNDIRAIEERIRINRHKYETLRSESLQDIESGVDTSSEGLVGLDAEIFNAKMLLKALELRKFKEDDEQALHEMEVRERAMLDECTRIRERIEECSQRIRAIDTADYGFYQREILPANFSRSGFECVGFARREIAVPKDGFAKEYPAWFDRWLKFGRDAKFVDECHRRGELPYAVFVKPFWVLLKATVITVWRFLIIFWYGVCLTRPGIRVTPLFHPFDEHDGTITLDMGNYSRLTHVDKWEKREYAGILGILSPLRILVLFGIVVVYDVIASFIEAWPQISMSLLLVLVYIAIGAVLAAGILFLIRALFEKIKLWITRSISPAEKENPGFFGGSFQKAGKVFSFVMRAIAKKLEVRHENALAKRVAEARARKSEEISRHEASLRPYFCDTDALVQGTVQKPVPLMQVVKRIPVYRVPELLMAEVKGKICRPFAE